MCPQTLEDTRATFTKQSDKTWPEILQKLAESNAESRPIWKPMHLQPMYRENPFVAAEDGKDVGLDIFQRGLCLPSDNKMTIQQQDTIIEIVKSCFK